jgi:chorismate mutase
MKEERQKIDKIDLEIVRLLCERFELVYCISQIKKQKKIDVFDLEIYNKRKKLYELVLGEYGCAIYQSIHDESCKAQNETD